MLHVSGLALSTGTHPNLDMRALPIETFAAAGAAVRTQVHPGRQGCDGGADLRGVQDGGSVREASRVRPQRVLRRLFLRHPACVHPQPGVRPHGGGAQGGGRDGGEGGAAARP